MLVVEEVAARELMVWNNLPLSPERKNWGYTVHYTTRVRQWAEFVDPRDLAYTRGVVF